MQNFDDHEKFKCDYFKRFDCRSCTRLVEDLSRLPSLPEKFNSFIVNSWVQSPSPSGLRSKARMVVSGTLEQPIVGILNKNLNGVELLECPQHRAILNRIISSVPSWIKQYKLIPYLISERTGELKGIIFQTNKCEDHIRIRFILRSEILTEDIRSLSEKIQNEYSEKISISINIQPIPHQIPEGPNEILISGDELLWETYNGLKIGFPAQAFMQVNPEITEQLYFRASEIVKKYNDQTVLDLFCGVGGFSLHSARFSRCVYGIEISEKAVLAADISAKENNILNVKFIERDLLEITDSISEIDPQILICNPPRRGLGKSVITSVLATRPEVLIYSSCNAESFLKDYEELSKLYRIIEITPFEMFPLTNHYELLVEMNRI